MNDLVEFYLVKPIDIQNRFSRMGRVVKLYRYNIYLLLAERALIFK